MEYINSEYLIRIAMAIILGFLLGLERELTNKYAGLRTHILVCLGACVFTIISIYGFPTFVDGDNVIVHQATGIRDSGRVAAQIVTGIGFIGAGTVLRNGPIIIGLTTAATLWISAAIGMTCGVGMFDVAILTTVLSVAVLTLIRVFERRFLPSSIKQNKRFKITLYCSNNDVIKVQEIMASFVENIEEFSSKKLLENPEKSKITSTIELCHKKLVGEIYKQLTEQYSFDSVKIQELND
jgi:putative Mg2+ transporter-C (MgtC) family protein